MNIQIKQKKSVIVLIAMCVAALLVLSALFCAAPKVLSAKAEDGNTLSYDENLQELTYFTPTFTSRRQMYILFTFTRGSQTKLFDFDWFDSFPKFYTMSLTDAFFVNGAEYSVSVECFDDEYAEVETGDNYFVSNKIVFTIPGSHVELPPTPSKEGYTFISWFLDEACKIPYKGEPITEDMTLYAGWIINRYTVTFDSTLGSNVPPQTVDWNTLLTLTTPTLEGYTFLGWYNGDTLYTAEIPVTSNLTLIAKWKIKTYTVTFMVEGEVYKTIEVEHGSTLEQAMEKAKMSYFNLLSNGIKDGKSGIVTADMTAEAAAMTAKEKTAAFFANNSWVLWLGGVCSALFFVTIITLIVKKVRG